MIDLTEAEQTVYAAVVAEQPIAVDELADITGLADSVLHAAAEQLQRKGLVNRSTLDQQQLIASPPDIALGALLLDREEQLKRARLEVDKLAALHQRVASFVADQASLVEVISGPDAVLRRFVQEQQASRDEIRIIDRPPYVDPDPYSNVAIEKEQIGRGVGYRAIYDPRGLDSYHDLSGDVQASIEAGVDARVLPAAPLKMMLADDRMAMIPSQTEADEVDSVVIVHPSALLDALSVLFEQLWERALPLVPPGGTWPTACNSAVIPTDDDRRILSLLTVGLPDESIAKHLDISHRTMQRRLRVMLDRLGVQTRFQAAIRAVALGWLPNPSTGDRSIEPASRIRPPNVPAIMSKAG